jgi:hypothetical protein
VVDWEGVQQAESRIKEASKKAASDVWRRKVEESASVDKMWGLLKGLKNGPAKQEGDRILKYKGAGRASKKSKANAFASEYAAVSKLTIPSTHRQMKKANARRLKR